MVATILVQDAIPVTAKSDCSVQKTGIGRYLQNVVSMSMGSWELMPRVPAACSIRVLPSLPTATKLRPATPVGPSFVAPSRIDLIVWVLWVERGMFSMKY